MSSGLNLGIILDKTVILIILIFPTHEHGKSFHLLILLSPLIIPYSFPCVGILTPLLMCLIFLTIVNEVCLISFASCSLSDKQFCHVDFVACYFAVLIYYF